MTEAKYRVGMIGIGRKGAQHARAYRIDPRTQIVAAADTDEENLEVFCKRFGVRGYTDYREMLSKESIDIAAPILPVGPNPAVVIGCAEAGVKGILCEKPFAPSLKEADAMVAACRANGVKIGAGDLNINLPAYQTAAKMIAEGEIGEVKSIHFYGGGGTELSGGGIQQFSLMRMFAGFAEVAWCIGWVDDDPLEGLRPGRLRLRAVRERGRGLHQPRKGRQRLRIPGQLHQWSLRQQLGCPAHVQVAGRRLLVGDHGEDRGAVPGNQCHREDERPPRAGRLALAGRPEPCKRLTVRRLPGAGTSTRPGSGDNGRKVLEIAIGLRESHRQGHAPVRFPIEDRDLRMIPHASRMNYKKLQVGREAYMRQMASHVDDDLVKV